MNEAVSVTFDTASSWLLDFLVGWLGLAEPCGIGAEPCEVLTEPYGIGAGPCGVLALPTWVFEIICQSSSHRPGCRDDLRGLR